MIVGFKIPSYTDIDKAADFVQSVLLMDREAVKKALNIPGFIFYPNDASLELEDIDFTSSYFTYELVELMLPYYINISGFRLEVPYDRQNGVVQTKSLKVSDYLLLDNFHGDVQAQLDIYVKMRLLLYRENPVYRILPGSGDLVYTSTFDPSVTASIDSNGDLILTGDPADLAKYSLDSEGYIRYNS